MTRGLAGLQAAGAETDWSRDGPDRSAEERGTAVAVPRLDQVAMGKSSASEDEALQRIFKLAK